MRNAGLWLLLALFTALPSIINVLLLLLQPMFALFFLAMILVGNRCLQEVLFSIMLCVRFDLQPRRHFISVSVSLSHSFVPLAGAFPAILFFTFSLFLSLLLKSSAQLTWFDNFNLPISYPHSYARLPDNLQCTLVLSRSLVLVVGAVSSGSTSSSRVSILLIL